MSPFPLRVCQAHEGLYPAFSTHRNALNVFIYLCILIPTYALPSNLSLQLRQMPPSPVAVSRVGSHLREEMSRA